MTHGEIYWCNPLRSRWRVRLLMVSISLLTLLYIVPVPYTIRRRGLRAPQHYSVHQSNTNNIGRPMNHNNDKDLKLGKSSELYKNKKTHVRFLKVHKAGSTTIQNLLFRFALRHDLNVLLPLQSNYIYPSYDRLSVPESDHFDIFACHTVYSKDWFDSILPKDSVNIGIVRKPTDRFISAAFYYRDLFHESHLIKVPQDNFIHNLVQDPERYEKPGFSRTRNAMGKDFGFTTNYLRNDTEKINAHLENLGKEFALVMVMERFEESLVVLRRLLNWSLLDILYLRTNSHRYPPVQLEPWEVAKLNETCFLDFAIYDFFSKRLEDRIKQAGPDFLEELAFFNRTLENVETFCTSHLGDTFLIEPSKWNEPLTLSSEECMLMTKNEGSFITFLRERHQSKYPDVWNKTASHKS